MEPETQQRIVEVVDAGDRREHALHGLFTRLPDHVETACAGLGASGEGRFLQLHHSSVVAPAFDLCQGAACRDSDTVRAMISSLRDFPISRRIQVTRSG